MDLILWRHAHAGDPCADAAQDLLRPLTPKGERQAARMAEWLNRQLIDSTRVLVSPAVRAQQTAKALERPFKTVPALAPGADVASLLQACRFPQGRDTVLVVGHQPTLGAVVAQLLAPHSATNANIWSVRKGAVWWLRQRDREGQSEITVYAVLGSDSL
jgi:phosphohistidine phosphatase